MFVQFLSLVWLLTATPFTLAAKPVTYRTTSDSTNAWGNEYSDSSCGSLYYDYFYYNEVSVSVSVANSAFGGAGSSNDYVYAYFNQYSCTDTRIYVTSGYYYTGGPHVLDNGSFVVTSRQLKQATLSVPLQVTYSNCTIDPDCPYCGWTDCAPDIVVPGTLTWQWTTSSTNWNTPPNNGFSVWKDRNRQTGTFIFNRQQGSYRTFEGAENNVTIQVGGQPFLLSPADYIYGSLSTSKDMFTSRTRTP